MPENASEGGESIDMFTSNMHHFARASLLKV